MGLTKIPQTVANHPVLRYGSDAFCGGTDILAVTAQGQDTRATSKYSSTVDNDTSHLDAGARIVVVADKQGGKVRRSARPMGEIIGLRPYSDCRLKRPVAVGIRRARTVNSNENRAAKEEG